MSGEKFVRALESSIGKSSAAEHESTILGHAENTAEPAEGPFTLVDDDDFNGDDGEDSLDGDGGEEVPEPHVSLTMDSDRPLSNGLAYAYVRPAHDIGGNPDAPFVANMPGGDGSARLYDFANRATESDPDFWTICLTGAYQPAVHRDSDPDSEVRDEDRRQMVCGEVDAINGQGACIYMEGIRETHPQFNLAKTLLETSCVVLHEIGHLFRLEHGRHKGFIEGDCVVDNRINITDPMIKTIRKTLHP